MFKQFTNFKKNTFFPMMNLSKIRKFSEKIIPQEKTYYQNCEEPQIKTLKIRRIDIGRNYFKSILPKRKKTLMFLLESYLQNLTDKEQETDFEIALDLYFKNEFKGENPLKLIENNELNLSKRIYWNLYVLTTIDNMASQYARFDYLEIHNTIKDLNTIPKEKRRKSKFVLTAHPTNPNSIQQLKSISMIFKGVEQNDTKFSHYTMKNFLEACENRVFSNPDAIQESITYHTLYLPNLIRGVSKVYEFGLKNLNEYIDTPSTWITFDFSQEAKIFPGKMTFTHGLNLTITVREYLKIIDEAGLKNEEHFQEIVTLFNKVIKYSDTLLDLSSKVTQQQISIEEFLHLIPITNLFQIENKIKKKLKDIIELNENCPKNNDTFEQEENLNMKLLSTSKKLICLMEIFHLYGCVGQVRLQAQEFENPDQISSKTKEIFKEISILNMNSNATDTLILKNYLNQKHYDNALNLLKKFNLDMEIIPLLEHIDSTNNTPSKVSLLTGSNTRKRDGLILTELRFLLEYLKNPEKHLFMGQGVTAERGGGPFNLLHIKYAALTRAQRNPHIRTLQGHFLVFELASKDLAFTFLMNCMRTINKGDEFEPSKDYIDFLFELDKTVGVPQRNLWNSEEYNDFFVKNSVIKTLVESYNFAGSMEVVRPLTNIRKETAIVQAYVNSDRCSNIHPELAFWNRLTETQIKKMAKYYYQNNPHFKYIIFMYAYICRKYDLDISAKIFDRNDPIFQTFESGKKSLRKILDYLGLEANSTGLIEIWNQHIGLLKDSSEEEAKQKEDSIKFIVQLQIYTCKKFIEENNENEKKLLGEKIKILQCALGNMSPFCGKG